ncbi:MAG: sugar transferase [Butyrivibrio sp.]|nr:sugar transferase [Butyrivibrio sp.]
MEIAESVTAEKVVGNVCLTSDKEQYIAQLLARDNLARVNRESASVVPKNGIYVRYVKRILDILICLPVFILLLPINGILAVCTYFDVGRPIIFSQTRVGKDGKRFKVVKFRNMTNDTDERGVLLPPSQRVTKFGKFVRKYSLDELLNFWSVLKGDMSIIGPRPLPIIFEERYSERHKMRTAVKPGLECPRIIGSSDLPPYQRQFENDIWYVENVSFLVDCKMVLHLIKMVFEMKKRAKNAAAAGYFIGYNEDGHAISLKLASQKYFDEYEELCNKEEIAVTSEKSFRVSQN